MCGLIGLKGNANGYLVSGLNVCCMKFQKKSTNKLKGYKGYKVARFVHPSFRSHDTQRVDLKGSFMRLKISKSIKNGSSDPETYF